MFGSGGATRTEEKFVPKSPSGPRVSRHSGGWAQVRKPMQEGSCSAVLDVGPTSPGNINFLTGQGCSVYMADPLHELATGNWEQPEQPIDVEKFLDEALKLGTRRFNLVLLWDTLDYLPEELLQPLVDRLADAMDLDGRLLAYFHTTTDAAEPHRRFHITDRDEVEGQAGAGYTQRRVLNNRQVEKLFSKFASSRVVLARDKYRETIFTR